MEERHPAQRVIS